MGRGEAVGAAPGNLPHQRPRERGAQCVVRLHVDPEGGCRGAAQGGDGITIEHTLDAVRRIGGDATEHLFELGARRRVGGILQDDGGRSGA